MRTSGWKVLVGLTMALPLVLCFGTALIRGQVLAYRDAAHFYYPLEHWLAERWGAGEIPLWNSQDGNGVPVVAEATSAVFYPGKLIYALPVSFPRRCVLYVVLHLLWAAVGAALLVRDGLRLRAEQTGPRQGQRNERIQTPYGDSWANNLGPGLSAIAYAFGGSVLFQYSNVVFLVGAAWLPWTLWALRRMLDERRCRWLLVAAACLALTVLGGDAQTAYHAGLSGIFYGLLKRRRSGADGAATSDTVRIWRDRGTALGWLVATGALGMLLAAVQVVPTWSWTAHSDRVLFTYPRSVYEVRPFLNRPNRMFIDETRDEGVDALRGWAGVARGLFGNPEPREHHAQIDDFSVAPWRMIECVWPNVTGRIFPENRRWLTAVHAEDRIWIPSIYFGILPLLVACGTWNLRSELRLIRWLSWLLLGAVVASFGSYGLGYFVKLCASPFLDDPQSLGIGDGVGGLYWWLVVVMPGHAQFRYPAKLLVIATLAAAALAGLGWQHGLGLARDRFARRLSRMTLVSLFVALGIIVTGPWWPSWLAGAQPNELYGPLLVRAAWSDTWLACLHTGLVCGVAWMLVRRRSLPIRWLSPLLVMLTALEVAWANRWMVQTAPATVMQETALPSLEPASKTPQGVYRWPARTWVPGEWPHASAPNRPEQVLRWDVGTMYAKLHLLSPLRSLHPQNTVAPSLYRAVLNAGGRGVPHPDVLNLLGAEYVLLPESAGGQAAWTRCEPRPPNRADNVAMWRNREAFPAAWIVHACECEPFSRTTDPYEVRARARELLWPAESPRDLRRTAVVALPAGEEMPEMRVPHDASHEYAHVTRVTCNHFVLDAHLEAPGVVVWNQFFDPQWTVTVSTADRITRQLTPLRANLMMQGVALQGGDFRLDFEYQPRDVMWGAVLSGLSWLGLVGVCAYGSVRTIRSPRKLSSPFAPRK